MSSSKLDLVLELVTLVQTFNILDLVGWEDLAHVCQLCAEHLKENVDHFVCPPPSPSTTSTHALSVLRDHASLEKEDLQLSKALREQLRALHVIEEEELRLKTKRVGIEANIYRIKEGRKETRK